MKHKAKTTIYKSFEDFQEKCFPKAFNRQKEEEEMDNPGQIGALMARNSLKRLSSAHSKKS